MKRKSSKKAALLAVIICVTMITGACAKTDNSTLGNTIVATTSSKVSKANETVSTNTNSTSVKATESASTSLQELLTGTLDQLDEQEAFQQFLANLEQMKLSVFSEAELAQIQANRQQAGDLAYMVALDINLIKNNLLEMNANGETLTPSQVIQIEKLIKSYETEIQKVIDDVTARINALASGRTKKNGSDYSYDSIINMQASQLAMLEDINSFMDQLMVILNIDPETALNTLPDPSNSNSAATKPDFSLIKPTEKVRVGKDFVIAGLSSMANDGLVDDPGYKSQWYLGYTNANLAWSQINIENTIRIAIIDTGIDYTHPDLVGRVDNKEGYDFVNNDADAMDDNGHGTHVAGIIGATSNNGVGIAGTVGALDVALIPIKVLGADGTGSLDNIVDGIYYAIDKKVDIINMSVGTSGTSEALSKALQAAHDAGIIVVVAAGNESTNCDGSGIVSSDATYTVVALTPLNKPALFSNFGEEVNIGAPGKKILSTVPGGVYEAWDGTSMATPIVSGIAAMILSVNPSLTPDLVYEILNSSSIDLLEEGFDVKTGYGLVNAVMALELAAQ